MKVKTKENRRHQQDAARELFALYESDETAWLEQMSRLIEKRRYQDLDFKNLSEFLNDMAKRDRREVMSRLTTLLTHLLKWDHQPRHRSRSWRGTITTQRQELQDLLDSQTLKNHARVIFVNAYAKALKRAVDETGLEEDQFPQNCPYRLEDLLSEF